MWKIMIAALVGILACGGFASADDIQLKVTFFGSWQYSLDGQSFHGVGFSGKDLRNAMEGNAAAQAEMDTYKSRKVTGLVTGLIGGALAGVAMGDAAAKEEWRDANTILAVLSLPFLIASAASEVSATNHLLKGVYLYNSGKTALTLDATYEMTYAPQSSDVGVGLRLTF